MRARWKKRDRTRRCGASGAKVNERTSRRPIRHDARSFFPCDAGRRNVAAIAQRAAEQAESQAEEVAGRAAAIDANQFSYSPIHSYICEVRDEKFDDIRLPSHLSLQWKIGRGSSYRNC